MPVAIRAVRKGAAGSPGELRGEFSGTAMGTVRANDATGVYGVLTGAAPAGEALPVANIQEVAPGDAEILVTLSGTEPQRYAVRIERVDLTAADPNRNLLLRVTDERLLQTTGGIVQGMSGSPIVQNGRLVGAVTPCARQPTPRAVYGHLCGHHAGKSRRRRGLNAARRAQTCRPVPAQTRAKTVEAGLPGANAGGEVSKENEIFRCQNW